MIKKLKLLKNLPKLIGLCWESSRFCKLLISTQLDKYCFIFRGAASSPLSKSTQTFLISLVPPRHNHTSQAAVYQLNGQWHSRRWSLCLQRRLHYPKKSADPQASMAAHLLPVQSTTAKAHPRRLRFPPECHHLLGFCQHPNCPISFIKAIAIAVASADWACRPCWLKSSGSTPNYFYPSGPAVSFWRLATAFQFMIAFVGFSITTISTTSSSTQVQVHYPM